MRLILGPADAANSLPQFIFDLLTSPQYEPLRVGLRDLGGFLFGTGSGAFFGRPILLAALRRFARDTRDTRAAENRSDGAVMDLLMSQGARIRQLESELDDARESNARLRGVNDTLRSIANDEEPPAQPS